MYDIGKTIRRRRRIAPILERSFVPTVTVVIACYNYAHYLPYAVQSCINQPDVIIDVIIVDDASTDSSMAVANDLASNHANVAVLVHTENRGPVESFNDGARIAEGEFVVRLDADDLLTPGSLSRATLVAQSFPSVGLVYGHPLHFSGESLPKARVNASYWTVWPGLEWLTDRCRSGRNVITSPEVLMRRSLLKKIGYMSALRHSHDMELWLRFAAFSDIAYIHGADQAWHREHAGSLSVNEVDELVDLRERAEAFDVLFAGPAGGNPRALALKGLAISALTKEALDTAGHELDRGAGASPLFSYCLELARNLDPDVVDRPHWRKLENTTEEKLVPASLRLGSMASRLRGRIRSELQWRRWHRRGVY